MPPPVARHPYSILGGGADGIVHGGQSHVVDRHSFLHLPCKDQARCATTKSGHRVYYSRCWGGEFRERHRGEEDETAKLSKIKVLFVQGLAGTHAIWYPQLEYFASNPDCDVVAVDNRGVGLSDTPEGRWRSTDLGDDIIQLLENELHWDQCHLVGFSLGGMVTLEAALQRPQLFKTVTLISTHAGGVIGTMLPPWGISPFIQSFSNLGSIQGIDKGMELLYPTEYLDSDVEHHHMDEDFTKVAESCLGTNDRVTYRFKTAWRLIQQARKYVESGNAPEIRGPGAIRQMGAAITHHVGWDRLLFLKTSGINFLVIAGEKDNLVNYLNSKMMADALDAPLVLKHDAGHGINVQHQDEVNEALAVHFERGEKRIFSEGRRPRVHLKNGQGFPPGRHPWVTAAGAFLPTFWLSGRFATSIRRRLFVTMVFVSLILRLTHGPLYRRRAFMNY